MANQKTVYDFAVERSPGKETDKLALISSAALEEGLSYGKYMVKYNYDPLCLKPHYVPLSVKTAVNVGKVRKKAFAQKNCKQCGVLFTPNSNNQNYCCYACQQEHNKNAIKIRYHDRNPEAKWRGDAE